MPSFLVLEGTGKGPYINIVKITLCLSFRAYKLRSYSSGRFDGKIDGNIDGNTKRQFPVLVTWSLYLLTLFGRVRQPRLLEALGNNKIVDAANLVKMAQYGQNGRNCLGAEFWAIKFGSRC